MNQDDVLFTELQAVEILGINKQTLRQQRHRYSKNPESFCIPFVIKGRRIYYRKADIENYVRGTYVDTLGTNKG